MGEIQNDINYFNPIINDNSNDGGKEQMSRSEEALKKERKLQDLKNTEYRDFFNTLLENTKVITVTSEKAAQEMYTGNFQDFIEFAVGVARITEKELSLKNNSTNKDITNIFEETINILCEKSEEDKIHRTWLTVEILKDAWIYGEDVRTWWNKKLLPGETGEKYEGVYDYRLKTRNPSYRVGPRPEFPGDKK